LVEGILETDQGAEKFESDCINVSIMIQLQGGKLLTQLQVFLGYPQELCNLRREGFALDGVACAEKVLANEKGENINKMRVEGDLLECQIIN
jgi:hypothetical protein